MIFKNDAKYNIEAETSRGYAVPNALHYNNLRTLCFEV